MEYRCGVGVDEDAGLSKSLVVTPNPVLNHGTIEWKGSSMQGKYTLSIMDAAGRLLLVEEVRVEEEAVLYVLKPEFLPGSGYYYVKLAGQNGVYYTSFVLVR
ncbi:MAG: T9SS type A sorting domain-containing protein [Saprospiraceae bacterium]|nr:T9SS type A sorting domain-containing protein [Saprospiraceae bacterium]